MGCRRAKVRFLACSFWLVDNYHFVHSKVMAWVAFDRAADAVEARPETQLSDGERLPTKFMRKFASVDLTRSLTASCSN